MSFKFISKSGVVYKVNDEPVERYITSRQLHDKFMQSNGDQVVMLFGYNSIELLNIIEEHERTKFKMTREEAVKKMQVVFPNRASFGNTKDFINGLEALGLLKFEEPKQPKYISIEHCGGIDAKTCTVSVNDAIEALRRIDIICVRKES